MALWLRKMLRKQSQSGAKTAPQVAGHSTRPTRSDDEARGVRKIISPNVAKWPKQSARQMGRARESSSWPRLGRFRARFCIRRSGVGGFIKVINVAAHWLLFTRIDRGAEIHAPAKFIAPWQTQNLPLGPGRASETKSLQLGADLRQRRTGGRQLADSSVPPARSPIRLPVPGGASTRRSSGAALGGPRDGLEMYNCAITQGDIIILLATRRPGGR